MPLNDVTTSEVDGNALNNNNNSNKINNKVNNFVVV